MQAAAQRDELEQQQYQAYQQRELLKQRENQLRLKLIDAANAGDSASQFLLADMLYTGHYLKKTENWLFIIFLHLR